MVCKNGHKNSEGAKFCGICGEPLVPASGPNRKKIIIWIFSICMVGVLAWVLVANTGEKRVIRTIDAIGTVSLRSWNKIEKAEKLYEQLEDSDKILVINKDILDAARKEYERQNELIEAAKGAIGDIGEVTLDSKTDISIARTAMDEAKEYDVYNHLKEQEAVLLVAEQEFKKLMDEQLEMLQPYVDVDFLSDEMLEFLSADIPKMMEQEQYLEIEALIRPIISSFTDIELRNAYAEVAASSLCSEAKNQHDQGNTDAALDALNRSKLYQKYCEPDTKERLDAYSVIFAEGAEQERPKNGAMLDRTYNPGGNTFKITAGEWDACIKLELIENPSKYIMVYVRANETVTVNLLSGEYSVKYTTGPVWYGKDYLFGPDATYILLDGTMDLLGYTSGNIRRWTEGTYKITIGLGEEYGIQNISPKDF